MPRWYSGIGVPSKCPRIPSIDRTVDRGRRHSIGSRRGMVRCFQMLDSVEIEVEFLGATEEAEREVRGVNNPRW